MTEFRVGDRVRVKGNSITYEFGTVLDPATLYRDTINGKAVPIKLDNFSYKYLYPGEWNAEREGWDFHSYMPEELVLVERTSPNWVV